MSDHLLRLYLDPAEIAPDGYPYAWHGKTVTANDRVINWHGPSIKDLVREQAGHRCVRCGHPYRSGEHGNGEWSPCDEHCTHGGPTRVKEPGYPQVLYMGPRTEAQWRILTVHHLNGVKHDCRWWNLVALCQRCHLSVQTRVVMQRPYHHEHSDWFKPYVAGFYAATILGEDLTRDQVADRLEELLALEHRQGTLL